MERRWDCPKCTSALVTRTVETRTPLHPCRGMGGLLVPMVPVGTRAKVEAHERQDYIGTERVQLDTEGRPVMSTVVTRDDGTDAAVYAPVASVSIRED